ncbi:MAG: META domain-containing protein [Armatimonas sp.]
MSTRMALLTVSIRLKEVKPKETSTVGVALRAFDITPLGASAKAVMAEVGAGNKLRFVTSDNPTGPFRLLRMNSKGGVENAIALKGPAAIPAPQDLVSLKSVPLNGKLERVSQIKLHGSLAAGSLELILDGNAMSLDGYGNPGISTLMMPIPQTVTLKKLTVSGKSRVFALEGAKMPLRLVLDDGPPRLVILDGKGVATGFLNLELDDQGAMPLLKTTWKLMHITFPDNRKVVPTKSDGGGYSVEFLPYGRFAGRAGANRLMGGYIATEDKLQISAVASTRVAALPGSIEEDFKKALALVGAFKLQDSQLWLTFKNGSGAMVFQR